MINQDSAIRFHDDDEGPDGQGGLQIKVSKSPIFNMTNTNEFFDSPAQTTFGRGKKSMILNTSGRLDKN